MQALSVSVDYANSAGDTDVSVLSLKADKLMQRSKGISRKRAREDWGQNDREAN